MDIKAGLSKAKEISGLQIASVTAILSMGVLFILNACASRPIVTSAQVASLPVTTAPVNMVTVPEPPAPILITLPPAAIPAPGPASFIAGNISYVIEVIPASKPAGFLISQLQVDPEEAAVGDNVTFSVVVTNTGGQPGTYTILLKSDDAVIRTQDVTIDGGDSRKMELTIMARFGEFKVIAGQLTAGLRVFF